MYHRFFTVILLFLVYDFAIAKCSDYESQIYDAANREDFSQLELILVQLQTQNCGYEYIENTRYTLSQVAAMKADQFFEQGDITSAKKWLAKVEVSTWLSKAVEGDLAAGKKDWNSAAVLYNQAYDLLLSAYSSPPESIRQKLYNLASQALVLSENLDPVISRSTGQPSGIFKPYEVAEKMQPQIFPIPIQFNSGESSFSEIGRNNAYYVALYCKSQGLKEVTLIGHTDERGALDYNQRLSEARAQALKDYLESQGVKANISVLGKGETQPLNIDDPQRYDQEEIWSLNRRVELIIYP